MYKKCTERDFDMKRQLLFFIVVLAVSGCAYTPKEDLEKYKNNSRKHILRVSNHGYLIEDGITLQNGLADTASKHLTIEETAYKYSDIFTGAFELACENGTVSLSDAQKNECKKSARQFMKEVARCSVGQPSGGCDSINSSNFERFFVEKSTPIKLLVYFHGGLNKYKHTDQRMESQIGSIMKGLPKTKFQNVKVGDNSLPITQHWQFPVFVSWPSSALDTYKEHLLELREGRRVAPSLSYFSSPIILIEDLVTSVGEFPMNVYYQFTNDKDRLASRGGIGLSHVWKESDNQFASLQCDRNDTTQPNEFAVKEIFLKGDSVIRINRSEYNRNSFQHKLKSGVFIAATPFRYVLGSAWNGTIAGNAWKVMKRRARNMFDPTGDADNRLQKEKLELFKDGIGSSLGSFFESLFALKQRYPTLNLQLNLVGHSMGTIAINNLLEKYESEWTESGVLKNVVYMAAAASTEETLSIVPDLMKSDNSFDFFNLTLNRVSEVAEFYAFGFAPSGSLLVSIDKYHDEPEHHLKRTFGSEINVRSSLPAILKSFNGVKGNVVLKSFNDIETLETSFNIPVMHGDFGDLDYWLPSTWAITNANYEKPTANQTFKCEPLIERPYKPSEGETQKNSDVLFIN